jgi:hypothetical protein
LIDNLGHREGFTATGNAEQTLVFISTPKPFGQFLDGFRLISTGFVLGYNGKGRHGRLIDDW